VPKGDFIWKHLKPTTEYHQPVIVPMESLWNKRSN
jgi:hypothetical protein